MPKDLTFKEQSVKDSFGFAKEILHQNSYLFMVSLDIAYLFTNIALDGIKNIYFGIIYQ